MLFYFLMLFFVNKPFLSRKFCKFFFSDILVFFSASEASMSLTTLHSPEFDQRSGFLVKQRLLEFSH